MLSLLFFLVTPNLRYSSLSSYELEFKKEVSTFMQITTSWMEQGLTREKELVLRQLKRKLG
ncbi:MAG: hypothetical protein WCO81_05555 [Cyanobacteriota bacterium ELA615]|jgi:hypothetical protein